MRHFFRRSRCSSGRAVNGVIENNDLELVVSMAIAVVGVQVLRGLLQWMRNFSASIFAERVERDIRDELYSSLLGKSMTFHDSSPVGELMARVTNDVRELNLMFNPGMNLLIGSSMFLVVPVVASPLIYPPLIIVPGLFFISYILVQIRYVQRLHDHCTAGSPEFW